MIYTFAGALNAGLKPTCGTCIHFKKDGESAPWRGKCHRRAPAHGVPDDARRWPKVYEDSFCGEYVFCNDGVKISGEDF